MVEQVQKVLKEQALREIQEVLERGMVAAATALSAMLDRKSAIRVEQVSQSGVEELDESGGLAFRLGEPSGGIWCGVALFARQDVRRMLGVLMGGDGSGSEGMPFDEMNLSAACEVVGQMMDAAAAVFEAEVGHRVALTALQGVEVDNPARLVGLLPSGKQMVLVRCALRVQDVLEGRFQCLLPQEAVEELVRSAQPEQPPVPVPPAQETLPQEPAAPPQAAAAPAAPADPELSVRRAQFPDFGERSSAVEALSSLNASLLMGVPLEVSIVIGRTKRRIRDILEFGPGTVIDLDKQTGAPAEIIVNGQLLAYGDVIVIGDNYGVRVTEIVGTKELLDSLGEN